jgi:hypothetical protein
MRSTSIVFEKKNFDNIRVLNSKFMIVSRIFLFAFLRDRFDIFDVSRDLWLRVLAQRVKRQRFDDESQMMRNACRNSIFFLFSYDLFLFVRRFQIVSSDFFDMQCCSFSASTSRCRHDLCTLFVSKELDLKWRVCSRYKAFYRSQNATLNLKCIIFDLRATVKRRRRDRISSAVNKFIWTNAFSRATSSWFVLFYDQHQLREYRNVIRVWFIFDLVMQWINFFCNSFVMNTKSIVLWKWRVFQMIVSEKRVKRSCVCCTTFSNWFVASCWIDLVASLHNEWCRLKSFNNMCSSSLFRRLLTISIVAKVLRVV